MEHVRDNSERSLSKDLPILLLVIHLALDSVGWL
jgi:hypothetical protein